MAMTDGMELWRGDLHPKRLSHKPDTYYIAYGSNLLPERFYGRCPDAVYAGRTVLEGWRMLFKKSKSGCYATVEQDANSEVPCIVYKISEYDEALLDKVEGYPKYYYKRKFQQKILYNNGKWSKEQRKCIVYILHEDRRLGAPSMEYMDILMRGYDHWGFDVGTLEKAVADSIGNKDAQVFMKRFRDFRERVKRK